MEFYQKMGFKKLSQRPISEKWLKNGETVELRLLKMNGGGMIELVEGDWKPHISFTLLEGSMDDVWEMFGNKFGVMIQYKRFPSIEVVYLSDPSGNYVEIVREK